MKSAASLQIVHTVTDEKFPMHISRRNFVKLLGGSLAGFAVGGLGEALIKIPNAVVPILYKGPRIETWKITTCAKCPGHCGLRVRMIDDLPVQVFGNPLSPINAGGICPMGLTSIQNLYHPDRLTSPMRKVNGKFQKVSYHEAYGILSKALQDNSGEKTAFVAQAESDFMGRLIHDFTQSLKSEKVAIDRFGSKTVLPYRSAADDYPDFIDFSRCDLIINFGSQLAEISESPLFFSRAVNDLRSKRGSIVTFSPKLTPSAFKSKTWIPVLPEFYEDVALGLACVILNDGTYDKGFVQKNFNDFGSFRQLILEDYSPADVEKRTGVPSKDIIATAREFASATSPVAYFDESILQSSNGTRNAYAMLALNALRGFSGYGKLQTREIPGDEKTKSDVASASWNTSKLIGDADLKVLLIYRSNFIFNSPNSEDLRKAISNIPLVVSFSPFIDETTELADLIIPDHDDFEKFDAMSSTVTGAPVVSVQRPVVKPFYATAHTGDVLISLMHDLNLSKDFPYGNYVDYLRANLKPVYKHGKGMLMAQKKPTGLEKSLHEAGWQLTSYSDFDEFWDQMLKYGGWWDPFPKVEQFSPTLSLSASQLTGKRSASSEKKTHDADSLTLNIFSKNLDYKGNMLRNAALTEQFGVERDVYYDTWIEINPNTAKKLSVGDRTKVRVQTRRGSFVATAIHNPTVVPINIDVPFGLGHKFTEKKYGINPIDYADYVFDEATGTPSLSETSVKIE